MTTPLDIITDSLEKLGVYAPGEAISGADSFRGLSLLSDLVDQWNDDSIQLFQLLPITVDLQVDTQTYTVGQGGTVAAPRPGRIVNGPGEGSITIDTTTTLLDCVSAIEWNAIYNTVTLGPTISGTPTVAFYDPQYSLGLLSFSPVPDTIGTAVVSGYYGLAGFPKSLALPDVILAPGQKLGLVSNLAILTHSYFAIGTMTPELLAQAQQSKTVLTYTNRLSRAMSMRNVAPPAPTPFAPRT